MGQKTEIQGMIKGRKKEIDDRILFSYFDSLIKKEKINMHRIESSHVSLQEIYRTYIDFKKRVKQDFENDEARTEFLSDVVYEIKNLNTEYLEIKIHMEKATNTKFDFYIQEILISMRDIGFEYKKSI